MSRLGYPEQALKRGNEAIAFARKLSHPHSLVFAEYFLGVIRQYRKESRAAQENADGAIALSAEYGLTDWLAWATIPPQLGKPKEGRNEEGIAQIREGL